MAATLQVTKQPTIEPVTLEQVRKHARIDFNSDDTILTTYMRAARIMVERYLSRCLLTQTIVYTVMPEPTPRPDRHFFSNPLELTRAPVQKINSVKARDDRGNETTLTATVVPFFPPPFMGYLINAAVTPPQIKIGLDTVLIDGRMLRYVVLESIAVEYVAGYGDKAEDVPPTMVQAILMLTSWLYENRGDVNQDLPSAAQWLLDPDRLMWV